MARSDAELGRGSLRSPTSFRLFFFSSYFHQEACSQAYLSPYSCFSLSKANLHATEGMTIDFVTIDNETVTKLSRLAWNTYAPAFRSPKLEDSAR